jgi:hypothetical protein
MKSHNQTDKKIKKIPAARSQSPITPTQSGADVTLSWILVKMRPNQKAVKDADAGPTNAL